MGGGGGDDALLLEGMRFFAHHGDVEAERTLGSHVHVDVELRADLSLAGQSDDLADTIDYVRCYEIVRDAVEGRQFRLLEALAEHIAGELLAQPRARAVRVRVAKQPPLDARLREVAVIVERHNQPPPA